GGVIILPMAERLPDVTAACIAAVLDAGEVHIERDGFTRHSRTQFGVVVFDEGLDDDEVVDARLMDRLAFHLDLDALEPQQLSAPDGFAIDDVRARIPGIEVRSEILLAFCNTAAALGIESPRAVLLALRVARVSAAHASRREVSDVDAAFAARMVLAPRALRLPAEEQAGEPPSDEQATDTPENPGNEDLDAASPSASPEALDDIILEATKAALPERLLERLRQERELRRSRGPGGRGGPAAQAQKRGRPVGTRPARNTGAQRLNLLATLKTAAPWRNVRKHERRDGGPLIPIRKEDFRITRYKNKTGVTTLFVVDASGSQAAQRLAEVKGAIELLLHECYVRRDEVALIAFRGIRAELVLAPTRALARAKRCLAAIPGGGGTPLATGIDLARDTARSISVRGRKPAVVFLTDGRANIARDGLPGQESAERDALASARLYRAGAWQTLFLDSSRRPRQQAQSLAAELAANYLPLPYADAGAISAVVRNAVTR
ncbi:MAG TPA: VWA domain-containing protein, partial [Woeseiaceae bacterium]